MICLPNNEEIKMVIKEAHKRIQSINTGTTKMYEDLKEGTPALK